MTKPRTASGRDVARFVALLAAAPVLLAVLAISSFAAYDLFFEEIAIDREFRRTVDLAGLSEWANALLETELSGPIPQSAWPEHILPGAVVMATVNDDPHRYVAIRVSGGDFPRGDLLLSKSESPPSRGARTLIPGVWRAPWDAR